jgi:uncharacterized protein (DUF488 family)
MTEQRDVIFSIGYANRKLRDFIRLLRQYGIEYLVDVRSLPYSRRWQEYTREPLSNELQQHGITYVYMGDLLGGHPKDTSVYDSRNQLIYAALREKEYYRRGIARLRTAQQKGLPLVLLCAEIKPETCHRARLIGRSLLEEEINVQHIDENGNLKDQAQVQKLMPSDGSTGDLFFTRNW